MRASSSDQLLSAAEAILEGGVAAIEVTMTTPNAMEVIRQATTKFGSQVLFGVGTVLDGETARMAILAGAQFVASRERIRSKPRSFYEKVQALGMMPGLEKDWGYTMERLWGYLLNPEQDAQDIQDGENV